MAAYRFCRTDDIPLLVESFNAFCLSEPEPRPALTVDGYKRLVREIDLWASSCMLASEGRDPVGVLYATKRDDETLVYAIGLHPQHRRQGHGAHLLTSLGQKLAILGPPRLVAEIPEDRPDLRAFVESCGYGAEAVYADMLLDGPRLAAAAAAGAAVEGLAMPVSVDDLLSEGSLLTAGRRAWERTLPTLMARKDDLEGLAVASDIRLEAFLLHGPALEGGARPIAALGHAADAQGQALLGLLLGRFAGLGGGPVAIPRVCADEADPAWLESLGFRTTRRWLRYAAAASPG